MISCDLCGERNAQLRHVHWLKVYNGASSGETLIDHLRESFALPEATNDQKLRSEAYMQAVVAWASTTTMLYRNKADTNGHRLSIDGAWVEFNAVANRANAERLADGLSVPYPQSTPESPQDAT